MRLTGDELTRAARIPYAGLNQIQVPRVFLSPASTISGEGTPLANVSKCSAMDCAMQAVNYGFVAGGAPGAPIACASAS